MVMRASAESAGSHDRSSEMDEEVNHQRFAQSERMGKVDTAWLRMDAPDNLMMIVGLLVLRPGIAYADLYRRLEQRLLAYPRFAQCVIEDASGASWVEDRHFDLSKHLLREALGDGPGQSPAQRLQARLEQLCVEPLSRRRPLWQMHLIENYEGGSALLVRIHHCIADGMGLMQVMQALVDGGMPPERPSKAAPVYNQGGQDGLLESLFKPLVAVAAQALERAAKRGAADMGSLAFQALADVAALAMMEDDAHTSLKGIPGHAKRIAWSTALPLVEVKAVGRALQCSINDILLACVAGALGRYLHANGEAVRGQEVRVMVPVNLRSGDDAQHLGNQFGLVPLVLPVGLKNPVGRVYEVRRRMTALKDGMQPLMALGMLATAGALAKPAQDAMLGYFSRKTTAVMTNVPGPAVKQMLCGSCIDEAIFWVPQSGTVGLGLSVFSYGGGVQFGIMSDAHLCPQPQNIVDFVLQEFNALLTLTLMLPWGDQVDRL